MNPEKQAEFQGKQTLLYERLADALIEATPEWWNSAVMEVESKYEHGVISHSHSIYSEEHSKDIVEATDDIFQLTFELTELFKQYGPIWKKAFIRVWKEAEEKWRFNITYTYD